MKKVLLPLDGSLRSLRSIQMLKQFYSPQDATVTILMVIPGDANLTPPQQREKQAELDSFAAMLEGYQVDTVLRTGFPGQAIVSFAQWNHYDAILMTRASRGSQEKLGSVAAYIVREAPYVDLHIMHEDKL